VTASLKNNGNIDQINSKRINQLEEKAPVNSSDGVNESVASGKLHRIQDIVAGIDFFTGKQVDFFEVNIIS